MIMRHITTIPMLLNISTMSFSETPRILATYKDVLKVISQDRHIQVVSNLNTYFSATEDDIQLGMIAFNHFFYDLNSKKDKLNGITLHN